MKSGFTLIEMVITLVVLSIIGVFSVFFITNLAETYTLMDRQRELHQDATIAVERITRELRDAVEVTVPSTCGSTVSSLTFRRARGAGVDSNVWVGYSLSGGNLVRGSGATQGGIGNSKTVAANATGFSVNCIGTVGATDARYTVNLTVSSGGQTVNYEGAITPKNCAASPSFTGRCFSGDYVDLVQ